MFPSIRPTIVPEKMSSTNAGSESGEIPTGLVDNDSNAETKDAKPTAFNDHINRIEATVGLIFFDSRIQGPSRDSTFKPFSQQPDGKLRPQVAKPTVSSENIEAGLSSDIPVNASGPDAETARTSQVAATTQAILEDLHHPERTDTSDHESSDQNVTSTPSWSDPPFTVDPFSLWASERVDHGSVLHRIWKEVILRGEPDEGKKSKGKAKAV
jgi:hypothetical protein